MTQNTKTKKSRPPHGVEIIKGSAYAAFTHQFVTFVLHDQKAKDLYEWSKDAYRYEKFHTSSKLIVVVVVCGGGGGGGGDGGSGGDGGGVCVCGGGGWVY